MIDHSAKCKNFDQVTGALTSCCVCKKQTIVGKCFDKISPAALIRRGLKLGVGHFRIGLALAADIVLLVATLPVSIFIVVAVVVRGKGHGLPLWLFLSSAVNNRRYLPSTVDEQWLNECVQEVDQALEYVIRFREEFGEPGLTYSWWSPSSSDILNDRSEKEAKLRDFEKGIRSTEPPILVLRGDEGARALRDYYYSDSKKSWNERACAGIHGTLFNDVSKENLATYNFHKVLEERGCDTSSIIIKDVRRGWFEIEGEKRASLTGKSQECWVNALGRAAWRVGGPRAVRGVMRILCAFEHCQGGAPAILKATRYQLAEKLSMQLKDFTEFAPLGNMVNAVVNVIENAGGFLIKITPLSDGSVRFFSIFVGPWCKEERKRRAGSFSTITYCRTEDKKNDKYVAIDDENTCIFAKVQFVVSPSGSLKEEQGDMLVRMPLLVVGPSSAATAPLPLISDENTVSLSRVPHPASV
ncbi:MAG: hypothetical protein LBP65_02010 [Puniceicoccales bacterium]|jgi:hypothetical protein|nr:hypothetical protein [Puniceicoccales bacterium]